jgi:hypothetical protein
VGSNSFTVDETTNIHSKSWTEIQQFFSSLVTSLNNSQYYVRYYVNDFITPLKTILNMFGNYTIISIGMEKPYILTDVIIQRNDDSMALTKFSRVTFIKDVVNPFYIQKINVIHDNNFVSSQNVQSIDTLSSDNLFRLKNPLNLFYPYSSSDDEMIVTNDDLQLTQLKIDNNTPELLASISWQI